MATVSKIDSNITGLRFAEEASLKVLPGTPDWIPLEPNSYSDFGGEVITTPRNPINSSRQRKKGVVTDLNAAGGFNMDLTQTNTQVLMQGFMYADFRRKGEELVTAVDEDTSNPDEYEVASTTGFQVNDLIQGQNFTNAANNAVNVVTAIVSNVSVEVATGQLTAESSPPATAQIVVVGHRAGAGDIDVDVSGTFPVLTSTTLDFTTLGLVPGEWIFIGGDTASLRFSNTENNGFARVRTIAANALTLDKTASTMVTEASTTETVELYFGRVLKNETGTSIVSRSYDLERQLGAPDDALPAQIQAEHLEGSIPNEYTLNVPSADKTTVDLSFLSMDSSTIDGPTALKTGNRPALVESDAFNTSSDVSRIKLSVFDGTDSNPTALFAFVEELTLVINNNAKLNKAVGTLGACGVTKGTFAVSGSMTAYFADVAATAAIRANSDITFDMHMVKANSGISIDVPLLTLGDGQPDVAQDEAIKLPLTNEAATGAKIDSALDHTLLYVFFDYLPTLADA